MSSELRLYDDTAQSILEHAEALARLDAAGPARAYEAAVEHHVQAIRVLALSHIDPRPDRAFYKALKAATAGRAEVFVEWVDDSIRVTVEGRGRRHRFTLWNRSQMTRGED